MPRLIVIDAIGALAVLIVWYFCFARYNRRKGIRVLNWVQTACAQRGKVTKVCWAGSSQLLAELRFPPHIFEHARVVVHLLPRSSPVNWAISRWRKQKETLAFEADLYAAPRFHLEVHNHRWSGHSQKFSPDREWTISRPGPIVLTSRAKWDHELSPVINSLMASRERNFVMVRFSPHSPHFAATLELDSLPEQAS
ncbi:MAG: hypothetical protein JO266_06650, partial [Acidobacteria bacterium]|nr:hypothetical protein [Acidobacteriota bacterium]